jgi:hypothetical protein
VHNIEIFEEIESLIPDAGYRAVIPTGHPNSEESKQFFSTNKRCLSTLEDFKDAVKRYLVFDRGYRDRSAYSMKVNIADADLDLELWLDWKPIRLEIRKQMHQGSSLPPRKVVDYLERDEDLEVVAIRIPRWLKKKLETEAYNKNEQMGTYLREQLERQHS